MDQLALHQIQQAHAAAAVAAASFDPSTAHHLLSVNSGNPSSNITGSSPEQSNVTVPSSPGTASPPLGSSPTSSISNKNILISSPTTQLGANTFVHKLYNMVVDKQYQHLIAWNYTGTSFIVCNIMEFSREVLPKHFKHNNFSSFVRQLNMYGFHKVNKSPRGHRTLAENQIWEFSHTKFLRGRPDLLEDIKRKAMENETLRRETGDIHAHLAMMQVTQSDMIQQIAHLQDNFGEVVRELADTKRRLSIQQQVLKNIMDHMASSGQPIQMQISQEPFEIKVETDRPPIYITSPDQNHQSHHQNQARAFTQFLYPQGSMAAAAAAAAVAAVGPNSHPHSQHHHQHAHSYSHSHTQRPMMPLTVQTQNLLSNPHNTSHHQQPPLSPNSLTNYNTAINTPLPPSPVPGSPMSMSAMSQEGDDGSSPGSVGRNSNSRRHTGYNEHEGIFEM